MAIKIHEHKPDLWEDGLAISAGWICVDGRFLLLQRPSHRSHEALKWGVPGGKLEQDEFPLNALVREVFEETNLQIDPEKAVRLCELWIEKPGCLYGYHMFFYRFDHQPDIILSDEHSDFRWVTLGDALQMPLMNGSNETIAIFQSKARALDLI